MPELAHAKNVATRATHDKNIKENTKVQKLSGDDVQDQPQVVTSHWPTLQKHATVEAALNTKGLTECKNKVLASCVVEKDSEVSRRAKCTPKETRRATHQIVDDIEPIAKAAKHAVWQETLAQNKTETQSRSETLKHGRMEGNAEITQSAEDEAKAEKSSPASTPDARMIGRGIDMAFQYTKDIEDAANAYAADDVTQSAEATKQVSVVSTEAEVADATMVKQPEDADCVAELTKVAQEEAGL